MSPVHTDVKWDVLNKLYLEYTITEKIRYSFFNIKSLDLHNLIINVDAHVR